MTVEAFIPVDLRSDTVTRPSGAMRAAMASAVVADDILDGDPTTQQLQSSVAKLLGKKSALFFPSGSMANLTGVLLHTRPGTEILLDADSHIVHWDMAASAAFGGVQMRLVRASNVIMNAADLKAAFRPASGYSIQPSLVFLENTHNGSGGTITPLSELRALSDVARDAGLPVHLDGARLWNAAAASGTSLAEFAACADTIMLSFSKGLGAPVGAILVGSDEHMKKADQIRKRLGGGMRQSGIIAAGALYGLENNLQRLDEDHATALALAHKLQDVAGVRVVPPDTNIVMIDLAKPLARDVVAAAAKAGVRVSAWTPTRVRAVTHLDAPMHLVLHAANRLDAVLREFLI
ncbi:MAG: threonine aldolase family protein [Gemmatimonadaceae bacterium]